jgi:drug/metabolite transporter (DMT)-like permease
VHKSFFSRRPEVLLVAVTFLWGSTFAVTKGLVEYFPPLAYLSIRFVIASIILFALFPAALRPGRALLVDGGVLGLGQGLGLVLQVQGQVYTTASKSAFVTAMSTALTPLLALALHGDRPSRPQAAGVVLASLGLYLLTYPVGEAAWNVGDLLSVACAMVYTVVIVETARRARRHHQGQLTALQTAVAGALFVLLLATAHFLIAALQHTGRAVPSVLALELRPIPLDTSVLLRIAYMTLVCTVGTFLAQTWSMGRMSATHAAVVFALEPVFATGLALAIIGMKEWPGARGVFGAALVLAGVLASEVRLGRRLKKTAG